MTQPQHVRTRAVVPAADARAVVVSYDTAHDVVERSSGLVTATLDQRLVRAANVVGVQILSDDSG